MIRELVSGEEKSRKKSSKTLNWGGPGIFEEWQGAGAAEAKWSSGTIAVDKVKETDIGMEITKKFRDFFWGMVVSLWVFSLFLVTTLLYYNSHTLKFTLIKYTSQWLNNTFRTVLPSPQSNSRGFSSLPKESPYPSSCFSFHLSPCLWKPLIHSLSLWNCLFWNFI